LRISSKRLFKSYCEDVIAGISDVNKILGYSQLLDIIAFYENELNTLQFMLADYTDYLEKGNFLNAIFGERRDV
jgi:hypothetical protein